MIARRLDAAAAMRDNSANAGSSASRRWAKQKLPHREEQGRCR
jgi:hypothetical protein